LSPPKYQFCGFRSQELQTLKYNPGFLAHPVFLERHRYRTVIGSNHEVDAVAHALSKSLKQMWNQTVNFHQCIVYLKNTKNNTSWKTHKQNWAMCCSSLPRSPVKRSNVHVHLSVRLSVCTVSSFSKP